MLEKFENPSVKGAGGGLPDPLAWGPQSLNPALPTRTGDSTIVGVSYKGPLYLL